MDTAAIECQVCLRSGNSQLHLYCPTCARNALYEPRVQHAQVLLTREALGKEVELVLNGGKRVAGTRSLQTSETMNGHISSRITYERAEAECAHSTERTRTVLSHVEALRTQTKLIKDDIAKRKASLSQRQKVLTSIKQELVQQKVKVVEPLQKGYGNTENRWNALHNKSAESRIFLCREAARLYGLQQRKRKKGVPGRDSYLIGGVPIVDLRDINSKTPSCRAYLASNISSANILPTSRDSCPDYSFNHLSRPPPPLDIALPLPPYACRDNTPVNQQSACSDLFSAVLL